MKVRGEVAIEAVDGPEPDVCIIGAGPIGLTLALDCAERGLRVCLIEAGSDADDPGPDEASRAEIPDPRRHVPMDLAVRRGVGGASWLWGGRCVPFDDIDFEPRDFVPFSGWPLRHDDILPFYPRAARALDCGEPVVPIDEVAAGPVRIVLRSEYFAKQPKRALDLRARAISHPLIDPHLQNPVARLDLDEAGRAVARVVFADPTRPAIRAKRTVVACGGLETTRLLLASRQARLDALAGLDGALGRFYAGHFEGTIATVVLTDPAGIAAFDYHLDASGGYKRLVMSLPGDVQRREQIQNIVFWPDNRPFHDPRHHSGVKSFIYLLASTPVVGRKLVSEAIRLGIVGEGPRRYGAHLVNLVRRPWRTAADILDIVRDRFVSKRRKPGWLIPAPDGRYVLHYRAEQRPNPDSTVTLMNETDRFGMKRLRVDLRYTEEDARSAMRAHELLDAALRASGTGRLDYLDPPQERLARILDQARDGYHQTGTTRMGLDPKTSVVGPDCRVHGIDDLYIASCSVFPTSGQANPTLLATAFAGRLAEHLAAAGAAKAMGAAAKAS